MDAYKFHCHGRYVIGQ